MAIRERAPRTPRSERTQPPDAASIASHVAGVVDKLHKDGQAIHNPHELCRRADMAMGAVLEVVSPVLPEIVKEQVQRLIATHDTLYQTAKPSAEHQVPGHEQ